jgi:hypothetical protein
VSLREFIYLCCTSNLDSKTFVKAIDQNSSGFMYLKNKLPRIMDAKNKKPQIPVLIQDLKFEN